MSQRTPTAIFAASLMASLALAACTSDLPTTSDPPIAASIRMDDGEEGGGKGLSVLSRNMYLGASLDPIIAEADPNAIPLRVWEAWQRVQATNPEARVRALAAEIVSAEPDLIGLQEVVLWRSQFPPDNYPGGDATPASTVVYDFLAQLLDGLRQHGVEYEVAVSGTSFDVEMIMVAPPESGEPPTDIRLTDRDVILVRKGVKFKNAQSGLFDAYLPVVVGGTPLAIRRGWTSVDVKHKGVWIRFANTHLEQEQFAVVQEPQGAELRELLRAARMPVILVGDLNSAADGHNTRTYEEFRSFGYADTWTSVLPGFTCCQSELLGNERSEATERIDYVLTLGPFESVDVRLIGSEPASVQRNVFWPSDHFGVLARLKLLK
ncbi:MAG: endonuclease/exonuclease/phosphatase family protein [Gemmatimonadaceae bacterium]